MLHLVQTSWKGRMMCVEVYMYRTSLSIWNLVTLSYNDSVGRRRKYLYISRISVCLQSA